MSEKELPEKPSTLREQSGAVVGGVRGAVLHTMRHVEALGEYGQRQLRRVTWTLVGVALLLCAYMMLCFFAVTVLQQYLKPMWAVLAVVVFNALVGLIALLVGVCNKPVGVVPETLKEFKNDLECVKLYLKGKEKS